MIRHEQVLDGSWSVLKYTPFGPHGVNRRGERGGIVRKVIASGLGEGEAERQAKALREEARREALLRSTTPGIFRR